MQLIEGQMFVFLNNNNTNSDNKNSIKCTKD